MGLKAYNNSRDVDCSAPAAMSDKLGNYTGPCPFQDMLPVEIRIHIYEYILFENGNFFSLDDEEGRSIPTLFPKLRSPPKKRCGLHEAERPHAAGSQANGSGNIMSLLLTSNKMLVISYPHKYNSRAHTTTYMHTHTHYDLQGTWTTNHPPPTTATTKPPVCCTRRPSSGCAGSTQLSSSSTPCRQRTWRWCGHSSWYGTTRGGLTRPSSTR